jgi:methylisocitrate lyase
MPDSNPTNSPGQRFRDLLDQRGLMIPGAFNPLVAKLLAAKGARALYLSGAAFSAAQLALPDVGLFTLSELAEETRRISRAASLPLLVDADTGFGEALSVERTMRDLEAAGAAAIQLEDQVSPKRCGHLSGKALVDVDTMTSKIRAAAAARRDPATVILARTDARGTHGFATAVDRAKAYVEAGADAIFPEALETRDEFAAFRREINVPLIANMTEFGKTPPLGMKEWQELGYNGVLFPVTLLRVAMKSVEQAVDALLQQETQASILKQMQTRQELYDLLDYRGYENRDRDYFQG